jgi:hypothetical protein
VFVLQVRKTEERRVGGRHCHLQILRNQEIFEKKPRTSRMRYFKGQLVAEKDYRRIVDAKITHIRGGKLRRERNKNTSNMIFHHGQPGGDVVNEERQATFGLDKRRHEREVLHLNT